MMYVPIEVFLTESMIKPSVLFMFTLNPQRGVAICSQSPSFFAPSHQNVSSQLTLIDLVDVYVVCIFTMFFFL